jgi:hypothetical protein
MSIIYDCGKKGMSGYGKYTKDDAVDDAIKAGWDFNKDYYSQATSSKTSDLLDIAKKKKYKSNSSLGRSKPYAFFLYLQKQFLKRGF